MILWFWERAFHFSVWRRDGIRCQEVRRRRTGWVSPHTAGAGWLPLGQGFGCTWGWAPHPPRGLHAASLGTHSHSMWVQSGKKILQHFLGNFAVYSSGYSFLLFSGTLQESMHPAAPSCWRTGPALLLGAPQDPWAHWGESWGISSAAGGGLRGGCSGGISGYLWPKRRPDGSSCGPGRCSRCSAAGSGHTKGISRKKQIWRLPGDFFFIFFFSL